jgi:hypothetical protein
MITEKRQQNHNQAVVFFNQHETGEACTFPGTDWQGTGKDAVVLPCGKPTIGTGLFCDPGHHFCKVYDVCERHKGTMQLWGSEEL